MLYPPRCVVCRTVGEGPLCARCRAGFAPVPVPFCCRCACPLGGSEASLCRTCTDRTPPFAAARALAVFEGSVRTAVHRLKYQGRRELGPVLGRMLAAFVREAPALGEADLVVPVPLHASRERERGFNPALLLAAAVAEALDLPLLPSGLERTVPTAPQSALGLRQRWANVAGAFSVPATGAGMVRGRAVLLVDDVMTSGATAAECAAALRRAGAGRVAVVTLARATPPEARPRVEEDRPEAGESRPQSAGSRTAAAAEGAAQGQPPEGQRLLRGTMAPGAAGGGGRPGAVRAGRP